MTVTFLCGATAPGQTEHATLNQMVQSIIVQEQRACHDRTYYSYPSEERSERIKGHLWTERMVETDWGTVR